MEESKLRVLFECAPDFLEAKRMKEVVVIEKRNDGTLCGSNAVGDHRPRLLLPGSDPLSLTNPHLALEAVVLKIRDNDQLDGRPRRDPDRGESFAEEILPTPSCNDNRDGLANRRRIKRNWCRTGRARVRSVHGSTFWTLKYRCVRSAAVAPSESIVVFNFPAATNSVADAYQHFVGDGSGTFV